MQVMRDADHMPSVPRQRKTVDAINRFFIFA
jgi:hypothetical protein